MRIFLTVIILLAFLNSKGFCYNLDFFSKFNDKYLENYIQMALLYNHKLKQAQKTLEQYRLEVKKTFSKELPQASVGSNYLGTHFPRNDRNFFVKNNSYILPLAARYEPDFLLKNRDKTKSEKKLYEAQIEKTQGVYIALLVDVASAYVNLLLNDYLIEQQKEIIKNKEENYRLNSLKFLKGTIEKTDLNQKENSLLEQKEILDNFEKTRNSILCSLALLTGQSAKNIDEFERGKLKDFEYIDSIPEIINSDLIYNRPDIKEIEKKLKSAKIDIKIAKKDFFPSFNVTGYLVFDTVGPGNFFSWNSSFALLVAGLTQDIFKGGEKIANLKIKKARFEELLEEYLEADLNAIKELNNTIFSIKENSKIEKKAFKNVSLKLENTLFSKRKLERGVISNLEFLDSKTELEFKNQLLAASKATRLIDYFSLYKVLGGEL